MRYLSYSTRGDPATYVGSVRKAVTAALRTFGVRLTEDQATELTEAMLKAIEAQKLVLLPHKPTREMVQASMGALHTGVRPSVGWVDTVTKHQWRLYTSLGAAPDWREGCAQMPRAGWRTARGRHGSARRPRRLSLPGGRLTPCLPDAKVPAMEDPADVAKIAELQAFIDLMPVDSEGYLDGEMRARQKEASRERDALLIKMGRFTPREIGERNGFFSSVDITKLRIAKVGDTPYEDLD